MPANDKATFNVRFDDTEFDIKKFVRDHPGGVNTLKRLEGKSVSGGMAKYQHSIVAYRLLQDFKVKSENKDEKTVCNVTKMNGYVEGDSNNVIHRDLVDSNLTGSLSKNGRIVTNNDFAKTAEKIAFLEELESRLDWTKPIYSQLWKVDEHYDAWVNSCVFRPLRLFESPLLEALTYTPWYFVPLFWIPVICVLLCTQFNSLVLCGSECPTEALSSAKFIVRVALGVFVWSLLEYSLHRWVFHLDPGGNPNLIRIHFLIHGLHHKVPFDSLRQVFPPAPAAVIAISLYVPVHFLFAHPLLVFAGGLVGYLTYDMIHYYVHHGSPAAGSYLYAMKRYHSSHHFVNHDKGYGISSVLWDYVFMTQAQLRKLGFALHW